MLLWALCQTYKYAEDQIRCKTAKDLYQVKINISINL